MSVWKLLFAALTGLFAWLTWHSPFLSLTIFFALLTFVGDGPALIVKRTAAVLAVLSLMSFATACKGKEQPGPEPTPDPNAAVCQRPTVPGQPPWCEDARGNQAVCPKGYESLPHCP